MVFVCVCVALENWNSISSLLLWACQVSQGGVFQTPVQNSEFISLYSEI